MKRTAIALSVALLAGCSSLPTVDQIGTPANFAKCAAADVVTTGAMLSWHGTYTTAANGAITHHFVYENEPIVRALAIHSLGRVAGTLVPLVPLIGLSIAGYYALKWLNRPAVTATAAIATCIGAGRNLWLIR